KLASGPVGGQGATGQRLDWKPAILIPNPSLLHVISRFQQPPSSTDRERKNEFYLVTLEFCSSPLQGYYKAPSATHPNSSTHLQRSKQLYQQRSQGGTHFNFAIVFMDLKRPGYYVKEIGNTMSGRKGTDNSMTLQSQKFQTEDYLDIAIASKSDATPSECMRPY
uniref:18 kDa Sin3-associated polypeptide n=1 Tax=Monodelphis domestica TaxID=13616 RepID=A0A5F8GS46_MONDO